MNIGIPAEIKRDERRVALPPAAVGDFVQRGHRVYVQRGAGVSSGFADSDYASHGASLLAGAADVWARADLVIKVKEPQPSEYECLRPGLILFTYLHLAAEAALTRALLDNHVSAVAYETVSDARGRLPLLEPMSEVAGRMAAQVISHHLEAPQGGRGLLMGGVPGVAPAHVVILGAGTVGANAAKIALGMGARVSLLDINLERLRYLSEVMSGNLATLYSTRNNIAESLRSADALIGSVLIAGTKAPLLVTRDMLRLMPAGSVIVDVAVDQGGCVESTRPTSHSDPTYFVDQVLHYGVPNMPGAVPRTSSLALANAILPYALKIADSGRSALANDPALIAGVNTAAGHCTHPAIAQTFGLDYVEPWRALQPAFISATAPRQSRKAGLQAVPEVLAAQ
ncbi:MAG: alanine dehydrogenase [Chloroflexi bacterium]|nr:alanine dehydrogenase [Chloroflexota bacterium]MCY3581691.1 alanine dehydrogenase [Chloroflexota bacterium]MCY3714994.1 alanine dehydrogenase [Chloroflexota bacterium]MDE2651834.1 alanine dehydrogenase [Chloroflexota bacterium]MXV93790.1 alanine dehydrogenase [Chloroflexota bacterium]